MAFESADQPLKPTLALPPTFHSELESDTQLLPRGNRPHSPPRRNQRPPTRPKDGGAGINKTASNGKDRAKGRVTQWDSDNDLEDDSEDDAYVTSNDHASPGPYKAANGSAAGKGRGRDAAVGHFGDEGDRDDEELYG
jgi:hypothetical protein